MLPSIPSCVLLQLCGLFLFAVTYPTIIFKTTFPDIMTFAAGLFLVVAGGVGLYKNLTKNGGD